jgi:hypothetical protein
MFIHDYYKKIAIEAIKKDLSSFDEDSLKEVAYNEVDFNNRVFIFDYGSDVNYLYVVTVHPDKSADVEVYFNEYGYSVVDGKVE